MLGLAWNFGAFTLLLPGHPAVDPLSRALLAIAFAALGFLPAVFVDAALRPWRSPERRAASAIRASAYGLSVLAAALHVFRVVGGGTAPSALGLRVLALGYGLLVPALLWIAPPGARIRRGLVSAIALLAFGVCALHLSGHLPGSDTWSAALFGHHASLPLVLAILYEDYRFAFADLFLKRALALMLLAGIVLASYVLVVSPFLVPGAGRNEAASGRPSARAVDRDRALLSGPPPGGEPIRGRRDPRSSGLRRAPQRHRGIDQRPRVGRRDPRLGVRPPGSRPERSLRRLG